MVTGEMDLSLRTDINMYLAQRQWPHMALAAIRKKGAWSGGGKLGNLV